MGSVEERNRKAEYFTTEWLKRSASFQLSQKDVEQSKDVIAILDALIPINQAGFRGVVLTAIVGKYLNSDFDPLENFYDCNPRAIFEHGIRNALQAAKIPCGKSDPLNVAKNIQRLDYAWAEGKRPETAAKAAVDFLRLLDSRKTNKEYNALLALYFRKLYEYGQLVNSQNTEIQVSAETAPLEIGEALAKFVIECPEGGAVPQFIVGQLLNLLRENDAKFSSVDGYSESVYGTNTTSKKPADIWEVMTNGSFGCLFEVTVKTIDRNRIDDCSQSLKARQLGTHPITFICNLPDNVSTLQLNQNCLIHEGVAFQFLDIKNFIKTIYCLLPTEQQGKLIDSLQDYIFDHNRSTRTKKYWSDNFAR